jgi:hypothetical protein
MRDQHGAYEIQVYQIVWVMAVPAEGARTLERMLYLRPSMARVLVKPIIAALAVE